MDTHRACTRFWTVLALTATFLGTPRLTHAQAKGTTPPVAKPASPPVAKPASPPAAKAGGSAAPATPTKTATPSEHDAILAAATDLYDRGMKAMNEQRWDDCRASFLAAFHIDKYYQIAGSLGSCEVKLGRYVDAAEHLTFSLQAMGPDAPQERRALAEKLLSEVRPKVSQLTIETNKTGAEIFLDGRSLGRAPLGKPVFVEPGPHKLEAKLDSATAHAEVDARGGGTQEAKLTFEEPKKDVKPATRSVVPLVLLGGGALVAMGVGAGLFGGYAGKEGELSKLSAEILAAKHSCVAGAGNYDARCKDMAATAHAGDTMAAAGLSLLIGGGLLAAGAGLYWLWPQPAGGTGFVQVQPTVSAGGGGIVATGTW